MLNSSILEQYRNAWSEFDPDATGYIPVERFSELLFILGKPLGWDDSYKKKPRKQEMFIKMISQTMKTYKNHTMLFFSDVLDNLTLFHMIQSEVKLAMAENDIEVDSDEYDTSENEESSIVSETLNGETSSQSSSSGDDRKKRPKKKGLDSSDSSDSDGGNKGVTETGQPESTTNSISNSNDKLTFKRSADNKREVKLSSQKKKKQTAILEQMEKRMIE